jgi:HAD superfamily hydrolase (TIGR01509 family)
MPSADSPAAVVFDCDGLLLDTESAWTRAETVLYAARGVEFTLEHKRELLGTSGPRARGLIEQHLNAPGQGDALVDELHDLVDIEVRREAPPQPGAEALVAALRAQGTPLGLASNSPRVHVDLALEVSGLAGCFDAVLSAAETGAPKPAPDVYLAMCALLGAQPAESVALEDSQTGVASARAAGMVVVGVPSLPGLELAEAHVVAASLEAPDVWRAVGLRVAA